MRFVDHQSRYVCKKVQYMGVTRGGWASLLPSKAGLASNFAWPAAFGVGQRRAGGMSSRV